MTKKVVYYCDNCGKEISDRKWSIKMSCDWGSIVLYKIEENDLCEECAGKYYRRLKNES